jgi:ferritin
VLDQKIADLLNEQVAKEFYSAYLYLAFSDHYEEVGLKGYAHWYEIQAQEERDHALIIRRYLHDAGCKVTLGTLAAPDVHFEDNSAPLQAGYEHELSITASINTIYAMAVEFHDFRTMQFLDWFVKEQAEEEANVCKLISDMKLFGDSRGLYELDREYLTRVYVVPSIMVAQ